jgi:beta-galactosidase
MLSPHFLSIGLLVGFIFAGSVCAESPRQRQLIGFDWKFKQSDADNAQNVGYDDSQWQSVNLPHDWSIFGPFDRNAASGRGGGFLPTGIGWYRKILNIPDSDKGKQISLEFGGVYEYSQVWINGHLLGLRPYGFISFSYDITPFVNFGADNTIAVRVDNSRQTNCRWYSGSGIYRDVYLVRTDSLHIPQWGTYVTTPKVTADSATIAVNVQVENKLSSSYDYLCTILDSDGKTVQSENGSNAAAEFKSQLTVDHPKLWSIEEPRLYTLRIQLSSGGKIVDQYDTSFGIRTIEYDVNKGFFLNGKHVKLNGVCLHGDGGSVGVAVPKDIWRRRLLELKEMGCNAIRTSHNPPDEDFLDLCDELGFCVMDEPFDEWRQPKGQVTQGYHTLFEEWHDRDCADFIRRDRNHPSIVLWSAGNEIPDQTDPHGPATATQLVNLFHQLDPTRPVTAACDNVYAEPKSASPEFMAALDIAGYNYVDRWRNRTYLYYSIDREAFPQRKFIGTESTSMRSQRGVYANPFASQPAPATQPISTSGPAFFGSRGFAASLRVNVEQLWNFVGSHDYVIGDFMWTGIDYLGEGGVGSSAGVLDTAGFRKDGFYFYQSQWTTKPMVHAFPHWNWKGHEGEILPVYCFTNCDSVELFVNGKSYGTKGYGFMLEGMRERYGTMTNRGRMRSTGDLHLQWDVMYEPGTLRLVGSRGGQVVATDEITTTGEPASIELQPDKITLAADGRDIAHLVVKVVDDKGRIVPTASNMLMFTVDGAAKIIGVDNGSLSIDEPFKTDHRKALGGLALAILQSTRAPGKIHIAVHSEGLPDASIDLVSK